MTQGLAGTAGHAGELPGLPPACANTAGNDGSRLVHLEAARGIAALVVLVYHFNLFFPQLFLSGGDADNVFLFNGIFAVSFFFVLSGYVLSYGKTQVSDVRPWVASALKRYPRLAIPVVASVILAALWAKLPLAPLPEIASRYGPSITRAFYAVAGDPAQVAHQCLVTAFIFGDSPLNPVIWSMRIEVLGSLGLFAICWFAAQVRRQRWLMFGVLIPLLYLGTTAYYLAFALGVLLHEPALSAARLGVGWRRVLLLAMTALGVALSAYPSAAYFDPGAAAYGPNVAIWQALPGVRDPFTFWRVVGASALLWVLVNSPLCARVLSVRLAGGLGKLSFAIYLVHWPIVTTIGLYASLKLAPFGTTVALTGVFLLVVVATVAVSLPFHYLFDRPALAVANRFFGLRKA